MSACSSSMPMIASTCSSSRISAIEGGFLHPVSPQRVRQACNLAMQDRVPGLAPRLQNLGLPLRGGKLRPEIGAAPPQRIADTPDLVRSEHDKGNRLVLHRPQLGNGDLPLREHLEQHRLELFADLVHFIDQQHARLVLVLERAHERPLDEEIQRVKPSPDRVPIRSEAARLRFQEDLLQGGVEPSDCLLLLYARVTLEPLHCGIEGESQGLGEFRLAAARWSFDQNRLPQLTSHVDLRDRNVIDEVSGLFKLAPEVVSRWKHVSFVPQGGF